MSSFFFSWLAWVWFINFIDHFQDQIFVSFILSTYFLFLTILIAYVLLSAYFKLNCSSLSTFLRFKFRWLISSFLTYTFDAVIFALSTAFTVSHKFGKLYNTFHLLQNIHIFFLKLLWSTYYLKVCGLYSFLFCFFVCLFYFLI